MFHYQFYENYQFNHESVLKPKLISISLVIHCLLLSCEKFMIYKAKKSNFYQTARLW